VSDGDDIQGQIPSAEVATSVEAESIAVWHWFSTDQAIAATVLSRKCGELESNLLPGQAGQAAVVNWSEDDRREHRSYATSSILASVAFIEASINELYAPASHQNLEVGGKLSADEGKRLTGVAELIDHNNFLDRFQITLHLLGREGFDQGAQPHQDAKILLSLRNGLVHYKPQFRAGGGDSSESEKWVKALVSKRFSLNPFTGSGNPFFLDRCLSHGCTVWAWKAALAFADEFFNRVGVKPVYDSQRDILKP
jgi:hypothetical protein